MQVNGEKCRINYLCIKKIGFILCFFRRGVIIKFYVPILAIICIVLIGGSYFLKGFFNQGLFWLLPVILVIMVAAILYSIIKVIISYYRINNDKKNDFLEITRMSLEPKLGKGFILEAIISELSIFYYSTWMVQKAKHKKT
ncbi:hypothetical protein [Bacillus sp. OAE603]|uniref:hypothetical protein n=1 Tax=Gottfriedia sp. OAE603 TaxID=2663872 RepID=UPI00178AFD6D